MPKNKKPKQTARRSPAQATVVPPRKVSGLIVPAKKPKQSARTESALDNRSHRTARANGYWAPLDKSGSAPLSRAYALTPPTARRPASLPHSGLTVTSQQLGRASPPRARAP